MGCQFLHPTIHGSGDVCWDFFSIEDCRSWPFEYTLILLNSKYILSLYGKRTLCRELSYVGHPHLYQHKVRRFHMEGISWYFLYNKECQILHKIPMWEYIHSRYECMNDLSLHIEVPCEKYVFDVGIYEVSAYCSNNVI